MRNPWIHDDVPETVDSSNSRITLIGWLLWGLLVVGFIGFLFLASRGLIKSGGSGTLDFVLTAVTVVFVLALAVPILRKLLAISRLLAMFGLLFNGWLILQVLDMQDVAWVESVMGEAQGEMLPTRLIELVELLGM